MDGLDQVITERTHDAVVLRLGAWSPRVAGAVLLQGLTLYAVVGPLSLVGAAMPGAWLLEASGLWLVNERVLAWRWLLIGAVAWFTLGALAWKAWWGPPEQRVELGTRALAVTHRRFGRNVVRMRVPRETIRDAMVTPGAFYPVILVVHAGGTLHIPIVDEQVPAHALASLIRELATDDEGPLPADAVPAALRRLLRRAPQAS